MGNGGDPETVAAVFLGKNPLHTRCTSEDVRLRGDGEDAGRVRMAEPQPCFFFKESKTMMTPSAATIAAAVNPTVEISARE
jgi:hypothetical protein